MAPPIAPIMAPLCVYMMDEHVSMSNQFQEKKQMDFRREMRKDKIIDGKEINQLQVEPTKHPSVLLQNEE